MEGFLFSTCPAAGAEFVRGAALFSFLPRKENREPGSRVLTRIGAKRTIIVSNS